MANATEARRFPQAAGAARRGLDNGVMGIVMPHACRYRGRSVRAGAETEVSAGAIALGAAPGPHYGMRSASTGDAAKALTVVMLETRTAIAAGLGVDVLLIG
jgi:hypothetical protein